MPNPVAPPPKLPRPTPAPRGYRGKGELWDVKDRYLAWMVATNYAAFTIRHAHAELLRLIRFLEAKGVRRFADVLPETLDSYSLAIREPKNGLPPRPNYILHRLSLDKKFFNWLTRQRIILVDPAEDLEVPKVNQTLPHTILTQEEARRILDAPNLRSPVGYRDKALLELLYATGIRSRELTRLKIENIDARNRLVNVIQGKCRKDRVIPITPMALAFVMEYVEKVRPRFARNMKDDDGTLLLNWTGAHIDINRLCEIIRRNAKAAGIEKRVTALTFRHSILTHLLENGMGIRQIQEFAGHEKVGSTEVYCKVTLTGLRREFNRTFMAIRRPDGDIRGRHKRSQSADIHIAPSSSTEREGAVVSLLDSRKPWPPERESGRPRSRRG